MHESKRSRRRNVGAPTSQSIPATDETSSLLSCLVRSGHNPAVLSARPLDRNTWPGFSPALPGTFFHARQRILRSRRYCLSNRSRHLRLVGRPQARRLCPLVTRRCYPFDRGLTGISSVFVHATTEARFPADLSDESNASQFCKFDLPHHDDRRENSDYRRR